MFEFWLQQFRARRTSTPTRRRSPRLALETLEQRLVLSLPTPDHVVLVIEENHGYSQIIGSASAPYINSLAQQGALMTNSFAIEHPSQPNYLDLFSGSNQGVTSNSCPHTFSTPNLGGELIAAGRTFGGYSESLPAVGSTVCASGSYMRKHNPWVDFTDVPTADNLRFTDFPSDFTQLPTVAIVVPNQANDMHDGSIQTGDTWLKNNLDAYVQWAKTHNSLFILTFDEDGGGENNRVATIFQGPMVIAGQYGEHIDHFNMLRTIEDIYGLTHAGASASASPITDVFGNTTAPAAPVITAVASDTGISSSDRITSDQTLVFSGTAAAGSTVTLTRAGSGAIGTAVANGSGAWTFDYTGTTLTAGTYSFSATATDPSGNVSPASVAFNVTIDTTGLAPLISGIASDTGISSSDGITSDQTLVFSGSAEPTSRVTLRRAGRTVIGTAVADASGAWTFNYTAKKLAAGKYSFSATATDPAGNVSPVSASFSVTIDMTAPIAPAIIAISSDAGSSSNDRITNDPTLSLSGTAEAGSTVTLTRVGSGVIGTAAANGSGAWTFDYTGTILAAGNYSFTATATDLAGNVSAASASFSVTIDSTAPTADVVDASPDPRLVSVSRITLTFSEAVYGFGLSDLQLARGGGSNLLTASQTLTTTNKITWTLGNLAGLTGAIGTYTLTLSATGSGITDTAGNSLAGDASDTWQVVRIIDDGAIGFAKVGSWKTSKGQGFQSDSRASAVGSGADQATWTFSGLTPGQYRVAATWVSNSDRATNAPFTVLDGNTALATVAVNQRTAADDFSDQGVFWENLVNTATGTAIFTISGTSLKVRLSDNADGVVVADAVRIERVETVQAAFGSRQRTAAYSNAVFDAVFGSAPTRWSRFEYADLNRPWY